MKRVLVTGWTGFLGRAVTASLASAHYRISGLSRNERSPAPGQEAITCDLAASSSELAPWRWDAVVHLAGPVPRGGRVDFSIHAKMARRLADAIPSGWQGRLIHASSMTVYGSPQSRPMAENHPRRPTGDYALAKLEAEDILFERASRGLDLWCLRLPGLFSAERREGALYRFMRAAFERRELRVDAGDAVAWDVLHVDDAATAIRRALEAEERNPGAVNIAYGQPVDLGSIARKIAARTEAPVYVAREHPVVEQDIAKARRLLDWPPAALDERLDELWGSIAAEVSP